jgi:hypothetical protein
VEYVPAIVKARSRAPSRVEKIVIVVVPLVAVRQQPLVI